MYNCQKCGKTTPAGRPAVRVVTETRKKEYPIRRKGGESSRVVDNGGVGYETVREIMVCSTACGK